MEQQSFEMALWVSSLPWLCLMLWTVCTCGKKHRQSCEERGCYQGLFMPEEEWARMNAANGTVVFDQMYKLTDFKTKTKYSESCGLYSLESTGLTALNCSSQPAPSSNVVDTVHNKKRSASLVCEACCRTEMSFAVPLTVTDVVSNTNYTVQHFPSAFQIISLGHCVSEGVACGSGGTCEQATRLEWMLVVNSSGHDTFVPTSLPSHCTCVYT